MNSSNATPIQVETIEIDFSAMNENMKVEELYTDASDGDNIIEDDDEEAVMKEIEVKTQNYIANRSTESEKTDVPKYRLHEEMCKAIASRDNALAEYLIAKKKKLTIDKEEQEFCIAELKLKIKKVRLENLKLKADLQLKR